MMKTFLVMCTAGGLFRLLPRLCNDGIVTGSAGVMGELGFSASWTVDNVYKEQRSETSGNQDGCDMLCLSLRPLLALRIDLREWEILLLGTARTMEGRRSRRGWSIGRARLNGACEGRVSHGRPNVEKNERV